MNTHLSNQKLQYNSQRPKNLLSNCNVHPYRNLGYARGFFAKYGDFTLHRISRNVTVTALTATAIVDVIVKHVTVTINPTYSAWCIQKPVAVCIVRIVFRIER